MNTVPTLFDKPEFLKFAEHVAYLRERWRDEKEYENFDEYRKSVSKNIPAGYQYLSMTSRPFQLEFIAPDKIKRRLKFKGDQMLLWRIPA